MKFLVGDAVYYRGKWWSVKEILFAKEEYIGIYSRGKYAYVEPEDLTKKRKILTEHDLYALE